MKHALSATLLAALLIALGLGLSRPATAQSGESTNTPGMTTIMEGQSAPNFRLISSDGETHALEDLKGKKNLVLVFFRGTW